MNTRAHTILNTAWLFVQCKNMMQSKLFQFTKIVCQYLNLAFTISIYITIIYLLTSLMIVLEAINVTYKVMHVKELSQ